MNQYICSSRLETIRILNTFFDKKKSQNDSLDGNAGFEFFKTIYYNINYLHNDEELIKICEKKWFEYESILYSIDADFAKEIFIVLFSKDIKELKTRLDNTYVVRKLLKLSNKEKYKLLALEHKIEFDYKIIVDKTIYNDYLDVVQEYQKLINLFDPTDIIYENYYVPILENDLLIELRNKANIINQKLSEIHKLSNPSIRFNYDILDRINELVNDIENESSIYLIDDHVKTNKTIMLDNEIDSTMKEFDIRQYYHLCIFIKKLRKKTLKLKQEIDLLPEIGDEYMKAKEHFENNV